MEAIMRRAMKMSWVAPLQYHPALADASSYESSSLGNSNVTVGVHVAAVDAGDQQRQALALASPWRAHEP
jgi:hypothetical protein